MSYETTSTTYNMQNILNKIDIYRTKSIMVMESNIVVNYNTATPMVQFKFATRTDAKSAGQWNNNTNAYWFASFGNIVDLVSQMTALSTATPGTDAALIRFSNPQKMKNLQIRKNLADNKQLWFVFSYLAGEQGNQLSINCSCTQIEFNGILGYLKNLLSQYPTIAQMALMRYDTWYENVGKHKAQNGDNSKSNNNYSKNKSSGYSAPSQKKSAPPSDNIMDQISSEFGNSETDDSDIPF